MKFTCESERVWNEEVCMKWVKDFYLRGMVFDQIRMQEMNSYDWDYEYVFEDDEKKKTKSLEIEFPLKRKIIRVYVLLDLENFEITSTGVTDEQGIDPVEIFSTLLEINSDWQKIRAIRVSKFHQSWNFHQNQFHDWSKGLVIALRKLINLDSDWFKGLIALHEDDPYYFWRRFDLEINLVDQILEKANSYSAADRNSMSKSDVMLLDLVIEHFDHYYYYLRHGGILNGQARRTEPSAPEAMKVQFDD